MMKRSRLNAITLALLISLFFAVGRQQPLLAHAAAPVPDAVLPDAVQKDAELKDLQNLEEPRTLFNQDKGAPRLILLLSPT